MSRLSLLCLLFIAGCQGESGGGVPVVRSPEHFNQLVKTVSTLSRGPLTAYEDGKPLSDKDRKDLTEARLLYLGLRDYMPAIPNNHFALGKIARALGDDTAALEHFGQVSTLLSAVKEPNQDEVTLLAEAHGEMSRILVLSGRIQEAGEQADLARQLLPDDPRYQIDQASVLIQAKRDKEAKTLLERVLTGNPDDRRARALFGLLAE